MFSQENITNEDDVMMLSISNETELLFAEIDTIPDEYDDFRFLIGKIISRVAILRVTMNWSDSCVSMTMMSDVANPIDQSILLVEKKI